MRLMTLLNSFVANRVFLILVCAGLSPLGAQTYDLPSVEQYADSAFGSKHNIALLTADTIEFKRLFFKSKAPVRVTKTSFRDILWQKSQFGHTQPFTSFSEISKISGAHFEQDRFKWRHVQSKSERVETDGIFLGDYSLMFMWFETNPGIQRLRFETTYEDFKFLSHVSLLPVESSFESHVVFVIPSWLNIQLKEFNFEGYEIKKTTTRDGENQIVSYSWENIPNFKDDAFVPSQAHYIPAIIPVYRSVKPERSDEIALMPDVGALYKWYRDVSLETENEDDGRIPQFRQEWFDYDKGPDQINAVYEWVRDNIRYIAFEDGMAGFRPEGACHVYDQKYGDCKGMANLLKFYLDSLGYDARLAWIGTKREVPFDYSTPSLAVDNHMITAVNWSDSLLFLDATEPYGSPFSLAYRISGRPAMVENGDDYIIHQIPNTPPKADLVNTTYYLKPSEDLKSILVSGDKAFRGETQKMLKFGYDHASSQLRDEFLKETVLNGFDPDGVLELEAHGIKEDNPDSTSIQFKLKTRSHLINLGDELYVDLNMEKQLDDISNESLKQRYAPWYFGENYNQKSVVKLEIPAGFEPSEIPPAIEINHPEFSISGAYRLSENLVILEKSIVVYNGVISRSEAQVFADAILELKNFYELQITLQQIK